MKKLSKLALAMAFTLLLIFSLTFFLLPDHFREPENQRWLHRLLGDQGFAIFKRMIGLFGICFSSLFLYTFATDKRRDRRQNQKIDQYLSSNHPTVLHNTEGEKLEEDTKA